MGYVRMANELNWQEQERVFYLRRTPPKGAMIPLAGAG